MIPGGEAVDQRLLQPDEVQTLEIRTPVNSKMAQSRCSSATRTAP